MKIKSQNRVTVVICKKEKNTSNLTCLLVRPPSHVSLSQVLPYLCSTNFANFFYFSLSIAAFYQLEMEKISLIFEVRENKFSRNWKNYQFAKLSSREIFGVCLFSNRFLS